MTTSSENVLLQIPQVRYKKGDGSLFLMDQRLIWMIENRDTVAVSHLYEDIKCMFLSYIIFQQNHNFHFQHKKYLLKEKQKYNFRLFFIMAFLQLFISLIRKEWLHKLPIGIKLRKCCKICFLNSRKK